MPRQGGVCSKVDWYWTNNTSKIIAEQINTGFLTLCCSSINFWTYPDLTCPSYSIGYSGIEAWTLISATMRASPPMISMWPCTWKIRWCSSVYKASEWIPLEVWLEVLAGGDPQSNHKFQSPGSSSLINTVKKTVKKTVFISWLLLHVSNWVDSLIGPTGLLLVVVVSHLPTYLPTYLQYQFSFSFTLDCLGSHTECCWWRVIFFPRVLNFNNFSFFLERKLSKKIILENWN